MKTFLYIIFILTIIGCQPRTNDINLLSDPSLSAFIKRGGDASFELSNGVLMGSAKTNTPNTFLCTKENYSDFILDFSVSVDPRLNSGVQIRSHSIDVNGVEAIKGYQVEIDPSERAWSGGIYEESGRGWINNLTQNEEGRKAFKNGRWNKYHIEAIGQSIKVWVNGINTANLIDSVNVSGLIGFQVHSISDEDLAGTTVQWKDIMLYTSNLDQYKKQLPESAPETNLLVNKLSVKEKRDGWVFLRNHFESCFDVQNNGGLLLDKQFESIEIKLEYTLKKGSLAYLTYGQTIDGQNELQYVLSDDPNLTSDLPTDAFAGSLHKMKAAKNLSIPGKDKALRFFDQWSQVLIKFDTGKVEHWLNDNLVVEYNSDNLSTLPKLTIETEIGEVCIRSVKVRSL